MFGRLLIVLAATVSACAPRSPMVGKALYTVGGPYRQGDRWVYPQERFGGEETGLAVQQAGQRVATDREVWDDFFPLASHPTLQLPSVVRVTRLDTGTSITVRVVDRGPLITGRVLGLSTRAATMLGVNSSPTAVRVVVDGARSQALRDDLASPTNSGMTAAPRVAVLRESLSGSPALRPERATPQPAIVSAALPEAPEAGAAMPGQLFVRASTFSQRGPAETQANRIKTLQPSIARTGSGRAETFSVRAGPYVDVARADAALDQALRAGVTDARIVVE